MELNELKHNEDSEKAKIKKSIIKLLSENRKLTKGEMFDAILATSPLTKEQLKDLSAFGITAFYRGIIGMAVRELIVTSDILKQDGYYILNAETLLTIDRNDVYDYVKNLFSVEKTLTKKQIFDLAIKHFGVAKTKTEKDDNQLRSYIGDFLSHLQSSGILSLNDGEYSISHSKENIIKSYTDFIEKINKGGGEFFERYSAMLLKKYYEKIGFEVCECRVTGGSDDGGVDVVLRTKDKLGFKDFIMVQVKVRSKAQITVKEVREFIGAMHAKGGTRGIYITTSSFHHEAEKLISSVSNIATIDGEKVYEIAKECDMLDV